MDRSPASHNVDVRKMMPTSPYRARVMTHECDDFKNISGANILIYWPHGFGDWVQLAYVLPLLSSSNRYWITRFGDDNVSCMDNHADVTPIYLGVNTCDSGSAFDNPHFGIRYEDVDGGELELRLPPALYDKCCANRIDCVLWSGFPETAGQVDYPYHTKARALLPYLVRPETLREDSLNRPLSSSISFDVAPWVSQCVESRLRNFAGLGSRKMCIIGRNGYTSVGKNWGHLWREDLEPRKRREGEECREFMRLMLRKDRDWLFLMMEDRLFQGDDTARSAEHHAYSYAELFGALGASSLPFGVVMKALANLADLCVGVPAGPYHLCMSKPGLPTVGLWTEHFPSWFDEPKSSSRHVVSRNVRDRGLDRRPGSFSTRAELEYHLIWADTRILTGELVLSAVEDLL
jgi:hypothetical protein